MTKTVLDHRGSAFMDISGLEDARWERVASPWGEPSTIFCSARWKAWRCGSCHATARSCPFADFDHYRANIDALKRAGCTDIISVSACGSFREDLPPGYFVLADQSSTHFAREKSFLVALRGPRFAGSPRLSAPDLGAERGGESREYRLPVGGTYLAMEGRNSSTLAESRLYRSWGWRRDRHDGHAEVKLAREAEMPYALVAMVTDYDCWHPDHDHVTGRTGHPHSLSERGPGARADQARGADVGPNRTPSPLGIERTWTRRSSPRRQARP